MARQSVNRSFYGIAALGTLLAAGGTVSLVASARQSPPSPSQVKKGIPSAPVASKGKQPALPGFGQTVEGRRGAPSAAAVGHSAPGGPVVSFEQGDLDAKTNISRGKEVVYTDGDLKLTGMTAVYNATLQQLDAQGSLEIDDPKHHVSGDRSHVDRKKQMATIAGGVVITLKPTPPAPGVAVDSDTAKQRKYPVLINCDRAADAYKKEFIVLTGHLVFKQTILKDDGKMVERTLTAEHAEYDGKANKLHLFTPVNSYDSEGRTFDFTADVFVGTKEGEETLSTPGRTTVHFSADDTTGDDPAAADKGTSPPPSK